MHISKELWDPNYSFLYKSIKSVQKSKDTWYKKIDS